MLNPFSDNCHWCSITKMKKKKKAAWNQSILDVRNSDAGPNAKYG
jgi:hypothetical protein